ncbi:MAG: galactose mutarotase [Terrimicrobiaceae bacterium]|nr:galactose mutarotase [Terrimicrobiaceae bacterium]
MSIAVSPYGYTKSGAPVHLHRLRNANGMEVELMDYGATITAIRAPDRAGGIADIALGYDTLAQWERGSSYFGATVGRYGNRIAHGRFTLDGRAYQAPLNDGLHSLHGGEAGFDRRIWTARPFEAGNGAGVEFTCVSPDGEQGFPGALTSVVTFTLDDTNALAIAYRLTTDAPTVANLTNHTYFNLAGEGNGTILDHELRILAGRYTLTDAALIPTGELPVVTGTPMDFRQTTRIGARIDEKFPPLTAAGGYDHNYVLDGDGFRKIAEVREPASGRVMEVFTTEPGVQFYSGNFLCDEPGKAGHVYPYRGGFCLETQHFPDSPNHPSFPTTVLRPGETFESRTVYRFSTR